MKYLPLVLAALLTMDVSPARAEPISIFHVTTATMSMRPNVSGSHISFQFTGPGLDISGTGGMPCFEWCSGAPIPLTAGTRLGPIFISNFRRVVMGGIVYEPNSEISVSTSFFNNSGGLNPIATGFVGRGPTFSLFEMSMPTHGRWSFTFAPATDQNGNATSRFVSGTFSTSADVPMPTPEPGTFTLVLAGSAGAAWIRRRRHSRSA